MDEKSLVGFFIDLSKSETTNYCNTPAGERLLTHQITYLSLALLLLLILYMKFDIRQYPTKNIHFHYIHSDPAK